MKKKLLLTGASGLLGQFLSKSLPESFELITQSLSSDTDYRGSLLDQDFVEQMIAKASPDYIINLVGLTNVDQCEEEPHLAYELNAKTVQNIVLGLKNYQETLLIHISTDQVYEGDFENKEDNLSLHNYYAYSKYLGESYASHHPKHIILRTNFFGPSKGAKKKSISDWIIESCLEKKEMTLFKDVLFAPLHMQTLETLLHTIIKTPHYGVYNLGSRQGLSKKDFAIKIAEYLKLDIDHAKEGQVSDLNLKAYRPKDMRMDVEKFETTYQLNLPTLEDEIKKLKLEE